MCVCSIRVCTWVIYIFFQKLGLVSYEHHLEDKKPILTIRWKAKDSDLVMKKVCCTVNCFNAKQSGDCIIFLIGSHVIY